LKSFIRHILITVVLFLLLTAEWWTVSASVNRLTGGMPAEILAVIDDRGIQPWIMIALTVYIATFAAILLRKSTAPAGRWRIILLILFQTCVLCNYLALRPVGHAARDVLVLSGTCALGLGFSVWTTLSSRPRTRLFLETFLALIFVLTIGSLLSEGSDKTYAYRTVERSTGIWKNPNTFGLLMGCGFILTLGLLAQTALERISATPAPVSDLLKGRRWMILLVPAALLFVGLVQSLSRGAWLGTALAGGWLIHQFLKHFSAPPVTGQHQPRSIQWLAWLRYNQKLILLLLLSFGILSFWTLRHIEHPYIRRVFTVGNPVDFSWRNRVLSYDQALQMISDQPLTGYGWVSWQGIHAKFYQPLMQEEGAAITLNDYLIIGIINGMPALFMLIAYIVITIYPEKRANQTPAANQFLGHIAKAGIIVMLVGYWFDGGLFKLALAAPFWILAELGDWSLEKKEHVKIASG
jgi:O-antigen ligase